MAKKLTAILLAFSLVFVGLCAPASADDDFNNKLNIFLDDVVDALVNVISLFIAEPDWDKKSEYVTENFYEGHSADEFLDEAADGAVWSLGYANASIKTGDELDGKHYVGGSLSVTKKLATEVRDDQKVRTIAVSDGRGITIFSCIDSFGLPLGDVRAIRAQFQEYADKNNLEITAINISVLHQHCCVDTFGLNGDIVGALFLSSFRTILGMDLPSGKNPEFMKNLYDVTVQTMIDAVEDMEEGKLYYGSTDIDEYIRDKRDPQVYDSNLNRICFVPNDGSEETWILNAPMHCVGNGAGGTMVSGDYPYYLEKYINETAKADVFYILGAELAISMQTDPITEADYDPEVLSKYNDEGYARIAAYGAKLGEIACSIENETEIEPILNIAFKEVFVPVDGSILALAAKGGLLTNKVVKAGFNKYEVVTEVGYCELGTDFAISIVPGELAPEMAYGGVIGAEESWTGKDWNHDSFAEIVGTDKTLLVFGISNDQIGYILPENEWHSYFTENEEIVSTGARAGETIAVAFEELYATVR